MLLQNLRARIGARFKGDKEAGFTLIELLVVMLILGILAAIALPAFFNQKDKAGDAKAKEYVHSAQVAMETYGTENGGKYPNPENDKTKFPAALKAIEPTLSSADGLEAESKSGVPAATANKGYLITVEGTSGDFSLERDAATGQLTYSCTGTSGGCVNNGWGE
jgi:type IV pilus assembly protein PilA